MRFQSFGPSSVVWSPKGTCTRVFSPGARHTLKIPHVEFQIDSYSYAGADRPRTRRWQTPAIAPNESFDSCSLFLHANGVPVQFLRVQKAPRVLADGVGLAGVLLRPEREFLAQELLFGARSCAVHPKSRRDPRRRLKSFRSRKTFLQSDEDFRHELLSKALSKVSPQSERGRWQGRFRRISAAADRFRNAGLRRRELPATIRA